MDPLQHALWLAHQCWIQDFPEGSVLTPEGVPTCYVANFSPKLHENEEITGHRGARVPHASRSTNAHDGFFRFTSAVSNADLLAATWQLSFFTHLLFPSRSGILPCVAEDDPCSNQLSN